MAFGSAGKELSLNLTARWEANPVSHANPTQPKPILGALDEGLQSGAVLVGLDDPETFVSC
jgi:hypothetical protein